VSKSSEGVCQMSKTNEKQFEEATVTAWGMSVRDTAGGRKTAPVNSHSLSAKVTL
jgi:hypothetical protein